MHDVGLSLSQHRFEVGKNGNAGAKSSLEVRRRERRIHDGHQFRACADSNCGRVVDRHLATAQQGNPESS
jgi:hypothetical protein